MDEHRPEDEEQLKKQVIKTKIITLNNSLKVKIISIVVDTILNLLLFLGISGFYTWINGGIVDVLIICLVYTLITTTLKFVGMTFFPKIVKLTFGIINSMLAIISFVLSLLIVNQTTILSLEHAILFYLIYGVVKTIIKYLLIRITIRKVLKNDNNF